MSFKICLVGCGTMAFSYHGPSLRKYAMLNKAVVLAACCDIDENKAASFQEQFCFERTYSDIDTMLDNEMPDAVCLVVPEPLTAALSVKILLKGYPLIMEKPPGLNPDETLGMIEAAERRGVPNQVAFNRRYMPLMRELKENLREGFQPQEIQNIHYDFYRVGRMDADFAATAIHAIDAVKYIAGSDYRYVQFRYQDFQMANGNAANIFMYCVFESGTTAQINCCPVSGVTIERATVSLYDNIFFLHLPVWSAFDNPGRLIHLKQGTLVSDISGSEIADGEEAFVTNGFYDENRAFFDDLQAGKTPPGDLKSGLQSVEIADCIRKRCSEYHAQDLREAHRR